MKIDRTPTDIPGFDELIDGGFPTNSLVLLAGKPGTGKTIFSAQYLYNGAMLHKEPGIYISFAENRDTFMESMTQLGMDFEPLEKTKMFRFADMLTPKGVLAKDTIDLMIKEISVIKAKRLVIDSFNALSIGLKDVAQIRIFLHMAIVKMMRGMGVTTVMISESLVGDDKSGWAGEEFLADSLVELHHYLKDDTSVRSLEVKKMRITKHVERPVPLEITSRGLELQPQAEMII